MNKLLALIVALMLLSIGGWSWGLAQDWRVPEPPKADSIKPVYPDPPPTRKVADRGNVHYEVGLYSYSGSKPDVNNPGDTQHTIVYPDSFVPVLIPKYEYERVRDLIGPQSILILVPGLDAKKP